VDLAQPIWNNDLQSPDEAVRREALVKLGESRDLKALPDLRRIQASDESSELRFLAKKAILFLAGALPGPDGKRAARAPAIDDPDPRARILSVCARAARGSDRDLEILEGRLEEEEVPAVRVALIHALGASGGKNQIPVLEKLLEDDDNKIRVAALEAMSLIRDPAVFPFFIRYSGDEDDRLRILSDRALARLGRANVVRLCLAMCKTQRPWMVLGGLNFLVGTADPVHLETFEQFVNHADPEISRKAREGMDVLAAEGSQAALKRRKELPPPPPEPVPPPPPRRPLVSRKIPLPEVEVDSLTSADPASRLRFIRQVETRREMEQLPALLEHLEVEKDPKVLATLILTVGQMADKSAVEDLRSFLDAKDDRIRANAVESISRLLQPEERGLLGRLLGDSNNRVRANAALACWGQSFAKYRDAVTSLVTSKQRTWRLSAIFVISQIGEPASSLLPGLLEDPDPEVANRAKECWRMIGVELPEMDDAPPVSAIGLKASRADKAKGGAGKKSAADRPSAASARGSAVSAKGSAAGGLKGAFQEMSSARDQVYREIAEAYSERIGKGLVAPPEIFPLIADVTQARNNVRHNKPETKQPLLQRQEALGRAIVSRKIWDDDDAVPFLDRLQQVEDELVALKAELEAEEEAKQKSSLKARLFTFFGKFKFGRKKADPAPVATDDGVPMEEPEQEPLPEEEEPLEEEAGPMSGASAGPASAAAQAAPAASSNRTKILLLALFIAAVAAVAITMVFLNNQE
jgi:HEAT repeat protein